MSPEQEDPITAQAAAPEHASPRSAHAGAWLSAVVLLLLVLHVMLFRMKPRGEAWAHGWNLVAFWVYASPAAFLSGVLALWMRRRFRGWLRRVAWLAGLIGLAFPIVSLLVLRKAG